MTTSATRHGSSTGTHQTLQQSVVHGVLGGLAGGLVFGLMMQMMGMMGMVAMLVGSESVAVGWLVHLAISALFGAVHGALVAPRVTGWALGLGSGAVYGVVLWVVGALVLMPARMGMPLLNVNGTALNSLLGHVVFGLVLGAVVAALSGQRAHR